MRRLWLASSIVNDTLHTLQVFFDSPPSAHSPERFHAEYSKAEQIAIDRFFEELLSDFRKRLKNAIAELPEGPARFTLAHVNVTCSLALAMTPSMRTMFKMIYLEPDYYTIWSEFIDEVCSTDTIPESTQFTTRYALEGLLLQSIIGDPLMPERVNMMKNFVSTLLSDCNGCD